MILLELQNWRDDVRLLSFKEQDTIVTFTQIENETVLINQLPVNQSIDETIEIGQCVAKVRLYELDSLPSLKETRQYIRERNRGFGHFLAMPDQIN